jgi:ABC transporter substrate binding protein
MRRRKFITLLGVAAAWPLVARAQPRGKVYRIGFLGVTSRTEYQRQVDALRTGLRQLGYEEGNNIVFEYRWAEGRYDRLPELAAELVNLNIDVLVAHSTPGARAAKQATSTIPIVVAVVADPVDVGLVASLARPGGNLTGLTFFLAEICAKWVELIREAIPTLTRVAVIVNPANPSHPIVLEVMQRTAGALGVELVTRGSESARRHRCCDCRGGGAASFGARNHRGPTGYFQWRTNRGLGVAKQITADWVQASGGSERTDGVWTGYCGPILSLGDFSGQDSEGYSAGEFADRARGEIRAHCEPEDRQDTRRHRSAHSDRQRRRGDRIAETTCCPLLAQSGNP